MGSEMCIRDRRYWDLPNIEGLTAEAEQARDRAVAYIEKSRRVSERIKSRREKALAAAAA